jgi:phage shock protein PspC (stress-responsive transcriptional regulator)
MLMTIAALTAHTARRITELGALLGLIGGLALAAGVLPSFRKVGLILSGLLLAVGFALIIYALHFGKTF